MSAGMLTAIAGVYAYVAVNYARESRWGMCVVFAAYAVSNIGFAIDFWLTTRK